MNMKMFFFPVLFVLGLLLDVGTTRAQKFGEWIPDALAWKQRLDYRAEQIKRIKVSQERWDALMNLAMTGVLTRNFTDVGYKVIPTPAAVQESLLSALRAGMASGSVRTEGKVDQISGPVAKFVGIGAARGQVMRDMEPVLEAWAGVDLVPSTAYGLRIYQEGNTLTMHTDRLETHVVSAIVHVDRDVDEPWPIVIEGFDGRSVEVDIQPGQTLLYESAKCIHGRPRPLKGRWYTSLFIHYKPKDWNLKTENARKVIEPHWHTFKAAPSDKFATLRLTGTGYYEPDCDFRWCHLSPHWPPTAGKNTGNVSMLVAPDYAGLFGDEL